MQPQVKPEAEWWSMMREGKGAIVMTRSAPHLWPRPQVRLNCLAITDVGDLFAHLAFDIAFSGFAEFAAGRVLLLGVGFPLP